MKRRERRLDARCEMANSLVAFRQVQTAGKAGHLSAKDFCVKAAAAAERVYLAAAECVRLRAGVPFAAEFLRGVAELADGPVPELAFSVEDGLHARSGDDEMRRPYKGRLEYLRICAMRDLLNAYAAFCEASMAGVAREEERDRAARRALDAARRAVELGSNEPLAKELLVAWLENSRLEN
jgi:hypothetical protein